ncbi:hypothetical protein IGJ00_000597 [Enterococcus sp. AZ062]
MINENDGYSYLWLQNDWNNEGSLVTEVEAS